MLRRGSAREDAATETDRLVARRRAELAAWVTEWGFAGSSSAPTGLRSWPGRDRGEICIEDVLGVIGDLYRRPDLEARLLNARRVHLGRQALIDRGTFTVEEIATTLERPVNTVHKQVRRACDRGGLFTVIVNGEAHIPAVLLDEALEVRREWQPVVSVLSDAGMSGWGIWRWIAEPNAGLSGETAADVIAANPDRVRAAAERRAAQITA